MNLSLSVISIKLSFSSFYPSGCKYLITEMKPVI